VYTRVQRNGGVKKLSKTRLIYAAGRCLVTGEIVFFRKIFYDILKKQLFQGYIWVRLYFLIIKS